MFCCRLDGDAAGVERDALADQRHLLGLLRLAGELRAAVGQPDQPRRTRRPLADADHPAVAVARQRLVVEHLDLQPHGFAQSLCALGEFGGVQVAGRGVDEVACGGHRGRDRGGPLCLRLRRAGGHGGSGQHRDLAQAGILRRGLVAAKLVEPVGTQDQALDGGAGEVDGRQRCDDGFHLVQRACGHPGGATDHVGGPLVALGAQADGKHAGDRQRRDHQPVQLVRAAGRAKRAQSRLDLADCVGVQIGLGRQHLRGVIVTDHRDDQDRVANAAFRQRRADRDGRGLVTEGGGTHAHPP